MLADLLLFCFCDVRIHRGNQLVKIDVATQVAAGGARNTARRALHTRTTRTTKVELPALPREAEKCTDLLLAETQALFDAAGAEAVQALHDAGALADDPQADAAGQLIVQGAHGQSHGAAVGDQLADFALRIEFRKQTVLHLIALDLEFLCKHKHSLRAARRATQRERAHLVRTTVRKQGVLRTRARVRHLAQGAAARS